MPETVEQFKVVKNEEDQFSIWPLHKVVPLGWHAVGKEGAKEDCLEFINSEWTDMRPRSLRQQMDTGISS